MSETTISAASMRIVKLLVGSPPLTVSDLIKNAGVTRTAVTEQLNELVAAGFVKRTAEKLPGRGRPHHLYSAASSALLLLVAGNQHLVVPAIWRAIVEIGGDPLMRDVVQRVTRRIADHYRPRITGRTPKDRLRQITRLLTAEGHEVEVSENGDGQLVMRKRSCPFISMFEDTRTVCEVDLDLITDLVGAPVRQIACRHDGAPCCAFELVATENALP